MSCYGDEPCDVYDRETRTARREHACSACGCTIKPGDTYTRTVALFEGSWDTWKRCVRCEAIHSHLRERMDKAGDGTEFPAEALNCGDVYEDRWNEPPPPEIAALAFWLPGDPLPEVK